MNTERARVFITYRREDSAAYAGRLHDQLVARFGRDRVFMDIDAIEPGEDYAQVIAKRVGTAKVVLALIGKHWLTSEDELGRRRLDKADDLVRMEIAAALEWNARVIPVLVGQAMMPDERELPDVLQPLARRNAVEISDTRFHFDAEKLIRAIEKDLGIHTRLWAWIGQHLSKVAVGAAITALSIWAVSLVVQRHTMEEQPVVGMQPAATQRRSLQAPLPGEATYTQPGVPLPPALRDAVDATRVERTYPGAVPPPLIPNYRRGSLGVYLQDASGLPGASVASVIRDGTGYRGGLRPGDIITALDGRAVGSAAEASSSIGAKQPGQTVAITIRRGERERILTIDVQAWDAKDVFNAGEAIREKYDTTARDVIRRLNE